MERAMLEHYFVKPSTLALNASPGIAKYAQMYAYLGV
jgi:hypothetical protein